MIVYTFIKLEEARERSKRMRKRLEAAGVDTDKLGKLLKQAAEDKSGFVGCCNVLMKVLDWVSLLFF